MPGTVDPGAGQFFVDRALGQGKAKVRLHGRPWRVVHDRGRLSFGPRRRERPTRGLGDRDGEAPPWSGGWRTTVSCDDARGHGDTAFLRSGQRAASAYCPRPAELESAIYYCCREAIQNASIAGLEASAATLGTDEQLWLDDPPGHAVAEPATAGRDSLRGGGGSPERSGASAVPPCACRPGRASSRRGSCCRARARRSVRRRSSCVPWSAPRPVCSEKRPTTAREMPARSMPRPWSSAAGRSCDEVGMTPVLVSLRGEDAHGGENEQNQATTPSV